MPSPVLPLIIVSLLATIWPGRAQSLGNNEVEGICIYKPRSSSPDSVAMVFEYRSTIEHPSTSYIFPVSGSKIRVPPEADFHCIPYPARCDLDKKTALILIELSNNRFPQFARILSQIEAAWQSSDPSAETSTSASDRRHFLASESVRKMSEGRTGRLPAPETKPSVLGSSSLKPAALQSPGASPKSSAPTEEVGHAPQPASPDDPQALKKNLEIIQEFYRSAGDVAE